MMLTKKHFPSQKYTLKQPSKKPTELKNLPINLVVLF